MELKTIKCRRKHEQLFLTAFPEIFAMPVKDKKPLKRVF